MRGLKEKGHKGVLKARSLSLRCWYTNATSLVNKMAELRITAATERWDIMMVCETWFKDGSDTSLEGYNLYRRDRVGGYGGVCVYVRREVSSKRSFSFNLLEMSEQVWCELSMENEKILVGCIYRPPDASQSQFEEILSSLKTARKLLDERKFGGLIVAGDFNLPGIEWCEGECMSIGNLRGIKEGFVQSLGDNFLYQCVYEPTYVGADGCLGNILDLILCENLDRISGLCCGPPMGGTKKGHLQISWQYGISGPPLKGRISSMPYVYSRGDYEGLNEYFRGLNWEEVFRGDNLQDRYDSFLKIYWAGVEKFVPKRKGGSRRWEPWMNDSLKGLHRKKKRMWYALRNSGEKSKIAVREYRWVCRRLKSELKRAVAGYELELARDKKNPKRLFQYISRKNRLDTGVKELRNRAGEIVTDGLQISNILNEYFRSVFVEEPTDNLPRMERVPIDVEMVDKFVISVSEVEDILLGLEKGKSPGMDGISPYVLRNAAAELAGPLAVIFNGSLVSGSVPEQWRVANVTPLHKGGCRVTPSNYRPVSLTSVICKAMEKLVKRFLMAHLAANRLLDPSQHGFVPGRSCTTNLLETVDFITWHLWKKRPVDVIYLDFAKAFDTVPHSRLIIKLRAYGVSEQLLRWISAFLTNRKQRVVRGDFCSDWAPVTSGVPQGSVLGPILFIIYINDMPPTGLRSVGREYADDPEEMVLEPNAPGVELRSVGKKYADDSKLLGDVSSILGTVRLQLGLDEISDWSSTWMLGLNDRKCHVVHIGPNNSCHAYGLGPGPGRVELGRSELERDLGVLISGDLKWAHQCANASAKARRMLGVLRRSFASRNVDLWKRLYMIYVRPLLEYAVPVWCPYLERDIIEIEKVQKRATRIPFERCDSIPSYSERCGLMGIQKLRDRRVRGDLIQWYKLTKGIETVRWLNQPSYVEGRSGKRAQLRGETVKSCAQRQNFLINRVVNVWNSLPDEVVEAGSVNNFKNMLDKFLEGKPDLRKLLWPQSY